MYDVIIIGAGPAGSHTARRLAQKGFNVLVLEKRARPGFKACTGLVGMECVNTYGIEDKVIIRRLNSATLFSPGGRPLRVYRPEPQACVLDRTAFDVTMAERAQNAGATYRFGCRVTALEAANDGISLAVVSDNKEFTLKSRVAVLAAGFNPGLSRRAGLGMSGDYVFGAQAETDVNGLEETEVYFGDMAPGFFAWLVPTEPGRGRVGLLARRNTARYLRSWMAALASRGRIASPDIAVACDAIPLRPPARTYGERLIAVGDAAGQVKPTSGGGIFYGLIGADIAAATLTRALYDDDLSAKRLAGYQRAWRQRLGGELRTGYWARQIFEKMSHRQLDGLFSIVKAAGIDQALLKADDVSFDWHGRTVRRLFRDSAVTGALNIVRRPFRSGKIDP